MNYHNNKRSYSEMPHVYYIYISTNIKIDGYHLQRMTNDKSIKWTGSSPQSGQVSSSKDD